MQEEVTDKSIVFVSKNTKMTASVLKSILMAYLREREKEKSQKIKPVAREKVSLKELSKKYDGLKNIEINENNIKSFEKRAKKYGIEYALKKDKTTEPPTYLVFFKGKDTDILDTAFKEFVDKVERMSNQELVKLAKKLKIDLSKY